MDSIVHDGKWETWSSDYPKLKELDKKYLEALEGEKAKTFSVKPTEV